MNNISDYHDWFYLIHIHLLLLLDDNERTMNHLQIQEKLSYVSCERYQREYLLGYSITVYTQADKCTTEYVD